MNHPYKRIFLKISGEALAGKDKDGIDHDYIRTLSADLKQLTDAWFQIGMMVGAGNIFRWREQGKGIDPAIGHYAGMLATMVNSLVVQNIMYQEGIHASVFSAIEMPRFIKTINKISAIKRLDQNMVVICAGGSGNPFCSTDLWSVIRALELDCEIVIKCTNVDGVYDRNPHEHDDAVKYDTLTYQQAMVQWLKVMDQSAFGMAMENNIPTFVCHIDDLTKCIDGRDHGTMIGN